jgi:hypothetical protein
LTRVNHARYFILSARFFASDDVHPFEHKSSAQPASCRTFVLSNNVRSRCLLPINHVSKEQMCSRFREPSNLRLLLAIVNRKIGFASESSPASDQAASYLRGRNHRDFSTNRKSRLASQGKFFAIGRNSCKNQLFSGLPILLLHQQLLESEGHLPYSTSNPTVTRKERK